MMMPSSALESKRERERIKKNQIKQLSGKGECFMKCVMASEILLNANIFDDIPPPPHEPLLQARYQ